MIDIPKIVIFKNSPIMPAMTIKRKTGALKPKTVSIKVSLRKN